MITLTINIATLPDRSQDQVEFIKSVAPDWCEVHIDDSIGNLGLKRQKMLELSNGKYVVVIDDDDKISCDYFDQIKIGIDKDVDVVSVPLQRKVDDVHESYTYPGRLHPKTTQDLMTHFCVIKTELALQSGYRAIGRGEDFDFASGLVDLLETCHYIDTVMYHQYFITRVKEYDEYTPMHKFQPRISSGERSKV